MKKPPFRKEENRLAALMAGSSQDQTREIREK